MHPADSDAARMAHFHALDRTRQAEAIRRLAAAGMSDGSIARATGLSSEMICRACWLTVQAAAQTRTT